MPLRITEPNRSREVRKHSSRPFGDDPSRERKPGVPPLGRQGNPSGGRLSRFRPNDSQTPLIAAQASRLHAQPVRKVTKMKSSKRTRSIRREMGKRLHDLTILWTAYVLGDDETGDIGTLADYGQKVDYVAPGTVDDQREGYFRYQPSRGGSSDEFRFFVNLDHSCHRVEYWFLDWSDGACIVCSEGHQSFMRDIWGWLRASGAVHAALKAAPH